MNLRVSVYDGTRLLGSAESSGRLSISLAAGSNQLGFYLEAQTAQGWRAADFARSTVTIASTATPSAATPDSAKPSVDQPTNAPEWVTVKDPADWTFDCAHPPTTNPDPEPIEMQYLFAWARHCGGTP